MTTTPGADERRLQHELNRRGVGYAPQHHAPPRPRDWLDRIWDGDEPTIQPAATVPPVPPVQPPEDRTMAMDEPRWDWRRLLEWPYARLVCGACAALLPLFGGESAATEWGSVLTQARTEAGVGPAWVIAGVGSIASAVLVHRRRSWWAYGLLVSAFVGTVAMASPWDLIALVTGASR